MSSNLAIGTASHQIEDSNKDLAKKLDQRKIFHRLVTKNKMKQKILSSRQIKSEQNLANTQKATFNITLQMFRGLNISRSYSPSHIAENTTDPQRQFDYRFQSSELHNQSLIEGTRDHVALQTEPQRYFYNQTLISQLQTAYQGLIQGPREIVAQKTEPQGYVNNESLNSQLQPPNQGLKQGPSEIQTEPQRQFDSFSNSPQFNTFHKHEIIRSIKSNQKGYEGLMDDYYFG